MTKEQEVGRLIVPRIDRLGSKKCLFVRDHPFFMRAGEVSNSAASDISFMECAWKAAAEMHLNALVIPVYWECVEPTEGRYDLTLVSEWIRRARKEHLHLVFLWFGLWKNGVSDYVPGWVKRDGKRFYRILDREGGLPVFREKRSLTISPFCKEAVNADRRCFTALMRHIREMDEAEQTVLMIQVENEIGALGTDRDYSSAAEERYMQGVTEELRERMGFDGMDWEGCFSSEANEAFMAWHYAKAVDEIASAGKEVYPLPMYCNAWLRQEPRLPGEYPSGGPQLHNQDIWRLAAPHIDFYAPDIYLPGFAEICDQYCQRGNPLCIPEARRTADAAAYYLYALGAHAASCFSPFGIEKMPDKDGELDPVTLRLLDISEEAFRAGPVAGHILAKAYEHVEGMEEVLTQAFARGRVHGFLDQGQLGVNIPLSGCILRIFFRKERNPGDPISGGMVVETDEQNFFILAVQCSFDVESRDNRPIAVERYEEGTFISNIWKRQRILNGDERAHIQFTTVPKLLYCRIFDI